MSSNLTSDSNVDPSVPVSSLPPKALQAIYHAVTGKTESIRKKLRKNVLISENDIEVLYRKLSQEFQVLNTKFDPTVTINVQYDEESNHQYSSWEKFKALRIEGHSITSSITIKMEAVINVPGTDIDQRLVVSASIDSALPLMVASGKPDDERIDFGWMMIQWNIWETVDIKIDFVDFVIAKNFVHLIENWFDKLEETDNSKRANKVKSLIPFLQELGPRVGMIGAGIFLGVYAYFVTNLTPYKFIMAFSFMYIIWGLVNIYLRKSYKNLVKTAAKSTLPSVIILSEKDSRVFSGFSSSKDRSNSYGAVKIFSSFVFSIVVNVISSFVYAKFF